ncbi:ATP-binding protein [Cystobacter fuscus]
MNAEVSRFTAVIIHAMGRSTGDTLSGYVLQEEVVSGPGSVLVRAVRTEDGQPALVKMLREEPPSPKALERLKAEYEVTRSLDAKGVLQARNLVTKPRASLVFEGFAGQSLRRLMAAGPMDLSLFLKVALLLAEVQEELHSHGVVHGHLTPEAILVDLDADQLKVVELGWSIRLLRGSAGAVSPGRLDDGLEYISPEQTGRTNRGVDWRSDLYSLGVILYEMLVGILPFGETEPMELVHSHMARQPLAPAARRPDCPEVLSRLVLKSLSKMPEDRYQSAWELRLDLTEVRRLMEAGASLEGFSLGHRTISPIFSISHKLYGRQHEGALLNAASDRVVAGGVELVVVTGQAGVGKTSIAQVLREPVTQAQGYFVSGKFDQFKRYMPYASLNQAFSELIHLLLVKEQQVVAKWKERILAALAPNGRVLTDIIPDLELLIGPQPPMPVLPTTESQNRLHLTFQRFLGVLTEQGWPFVLFLDDMQWADVASLALLQQMLGGSLSHHFLLVCACRENDPSAQPFLDMVEQVRCEGVRVTELRLGPLGREDIRQLLADTLLGSQPHILGQLAEVLGAKAGGNPFFLGHLLQALHTSGLISFDHEAHCWRWEMERIRQTAITDNVVELLTGKIRRLSLPVQELLKLASCVGNHFELGTLARITESSEQSVQQVAEDAVTEGLLISMGEARYQFPHDRVQQSAYSLILEQERPAVHLRIGRLLWCGKDVVGERVFDVVHQLNLGMELLTDEAEKRAVAELNLRAGRRAKASSAYAAAAGYLQAGSRLLDETGWRTCYELQWALVAERAECEYVLAHFEVAEALFDQALTKARTRLQRTRVYGTKVGLYISTGRYREAWRQGLEVLALFGLEWPETEEGLDEAMVREQLLLKHRFLDRRVEALVDMPLEEDQERLALTRLMAGLMPALWLGFTRKSRLALLATKLVNLLIEHGRNSDVSAYGFSSYSRVLIMLGEYAVARAFGNLAIQVAERYSFGVFKGRVYNNFGVFLNHWAYPAKTSSAWLLRAQS